MVKVCDAIMGTGKSSAAITYMNEHPEKRFIYITPYLEEANRIATSCDKTQFFEPQKITQFSGSKTLHTIDLVSRGENIATTHQAFRFYPQELLDLVKEKQYTLIIDENVDVLETLDEDPADIQMAIDAGYIEETRSGVYHLVKDVYTGKLHRDLFRVLRTRDLIKVTGEKKESFFYWQLPPELITSFEEVFILTYLFNGQSLHHFLEMYNIPYEFIGIDKADGVFRFSDTSRYVPDYVYTLKDMIHIIDNKKLNQIGEDNFALSLSWFGKEQSDIKKLKNNVYNFFNHICSATSAERMWSTYADAEYKLRGKGYSNGFIPFNKKATNNFKDRTAAAYCVNIFMNVGQKLFYQNNGVDVYEDDYALSIMVQWIWRSAIRDGKKIWLYVPSKRMRDLLTNWIEEVSNGGSV